jgi:hypothetical protein
MGLTITDIADLIDATLPRADAVLVAPATAISPCLTEKGPTEKGPTEKARPRGRNRQP